MNTPAPWRVIDLSNDAYDGDFVADLSNDLLIAPPRNDCVGDPLADAYLIAHAPDLLEAAKKVALYLGANQINDEATKIHDIICDAIAKASGVQK